MDFPSIWKDTSIVFTGAFGILGLLKDFKNKLTKKITIWGHISLAGIVVSTVMALSAQLIENQNNSSKALEDSHQALEAAVQTQRLLSSIKQVKIKVSFAIPCSDDSFRAFCQGIPEQPLLLTDDRATILYKRLWKTVPSGKNKDGIDLLATVALIKGIKKAEAYVASGHKRPDLAFIIFANSLNKNDRLRIENVTLANGDKVAALTAFADQGSSSGEIKSALDIKDCVVFVYYQSPLPGYREDKFPPVLVEVILDNGRSSLHLQFNSTNNFLIAASG